VSNVREREEREIHTCCHYTSCRLEIKYYKRMCMYTYIIIETITTTIIITITAITAIIIIIILITTKTILLLPLTIQ
jgi:hypothetical protein